MIQRNVNSSHTLISASVLYSSLVLLTNIPQRHWAKSRGSVKSFIPYLAVWKGDSLLKIAINKITAEVECVESTKQAQISAWGSQGRFYEGDGI